MQATATNVHNEVGRPHYIKVCVCARYTHVQYVLWDMCIQPLDYVQLVLQCTRFILLTVYFSLRVEHAINSRNFVYCVLRGSFTVLCTFSAS